MQIELIAPASEDSTFLPRLGLGLLAALAAPEDEVIYTDDLVRPFDLERDTKSVDLVGISLDSKTARRGYDIAAAYRRQGVKVVLGGIHATAMPDEAREHADSVVVGEAEELWPKLLRDAKEGTLAPVYRGELPALGGRPLPRRELFRSNKYIPFQAVETMRGCPYTCEFCSVSSAHGTRLRLRPVEEVVAELGTLGKLVMFADDNVMLHEQHSRELCRRLAPLGKHWIGQCSLAGLRRPQKVRMLADSGCKGLFVGFESPDQAAMQAIRKPQNHPQRYRETVELLHEHGIATWGSFVFGCDSDDPEIFDRTVELAIDMKLTLALFAILTPYPGTPLYRRLRAEGRLTDERWWLHEGHDLGSPYFVPARMSREQLREGWIRAWQRFYSTRSIWDRWTLRSSSSWVQRLAYLPLNLLQQRLARRKVAEGVARFRTGTA
jgi:radical SAM superfamily enzyme YgiQ (UPF0313 family)